LISEQQLVDELHSRVMAGGLPSELMRWLMKEMRIELGEVVVGDHETHLLFP
jgi:hypothetical protein